MIEMDAASHTGVDDVREIIEAVRYAAVSARYKIYIIDEVHMLSKNAFNALLKTLEEPPAHVKFLFATTEVNKLPITVLSRCQRFDLKRITPDLLVDNFKMICTNESVEAEEEGLVLIAQAAEGSARDGQSILDQAISYADMEGGSKVTTTQVRAMLGLSDSGATRRLFGLLLTGDAQAMLSESVAQYALGIEPQAMFAGLLNEVHLLTLAKVGGPADPAMAQDARDEAEQRADGLTFPLLHRLWQLLLKGHEEVSRAAAPREAGDMALLRITHAATMPDPGELAKLMAQGASPEVSAPTPSAAPAPAATPTAPASTGAAPPPGASPQAKSQTSAMPENFEALLSLLGDHNYVNLEMTLRDVMRIVEFAPPLLAYQLSGPVAPGFMAEFSEGLRAVTGKRWRLEQRDGEAQPSIYERERAVADAERDAIMESPLVKAAFAAFPDAELLDSKDTEDQRSASA